MPSIRTVATVAVVTMGTMYLLNLAAAKSTAARKIIRGVSVNAVDNGAVAV